MDNPGTDVAAEVRRRSPAPRTRPPRRSTTTSRKPLITCDEDGNKLLLSAPLIEGTQLKSAQAPPPQPAERAVDGQPDFNGAGRKIFADVTQQIANQTSSLTGQQKQFAIVLDGKVISAPTVNERDPQRPGRDQRQLHAEVRAVARQQPEVRRAAAEVRGPRGQRGGADAGRRPARPPASSPGAIGLGLVLIYCLLYYRGLGIVVVASLVDRRRDHLRGGAGDEPGRELHADPARHRGTDRRGRASPRTRSSCTSNGSATRCATGKSMRVAVEAGWVRARATCLAADSVSLLAAVVLYIFSIGVVKGFAFALGISTVIDLVVFFLFTKPMVVLARDVQVLLLGAQVVGALTGPGRHARRTPAPARTAPAGGNA